MNPLGEAAQASLITESRIRLAPKVRELLRALPDMKNVSITMDTVLWNDSSDALQVVFTRYADAGFWESRTVFTVLDFDENAILLNARAALQRAVDTDADELDDIL